jgi:hypothetical protein
LEMTQHASLLKAASAHHFRRALTPSAGLLIPSPGTLIAEIRKEILAERFAGRSMRLVLTADKRELTDDSVSVAEAALFGKKIACSAVALV